MKTEHEKTNVSRLRRVENSSDGHIRWLCVCICGKEFITKGTYLKTGRTKSCGCVRVDKREITNAKRFVDLEGKRFTRLKVIEMWKKVGDIFYWRCRCRCGKIFFADGTQLKRGLCRSCGCLKSELISKKSKKSVRARTRGKDGKFI